MFLSIEKPSVAECWISAIQQVFFEGDKIESEYDSGDDLPTRDCSSAIHVTEPFSKPFAIRGKIREVAGSIIYCHPADIYCMESIKGGYLTEVMAGDRDKDIWENETSYPYTYHDRLFNYKAMNVEDKSYLKNVNDELLRSVSEIPGMDQVEYIVEKLKKSPYSRRAQAITWRPLSDPARDDPPCLQRIWFRVQDGILKMNTHWRSRDLFGAWEANINGMFQIANHVAEELGVTFGEYFDFCDSLHIYGRKKLIFKEVVPLLERVKTQEGLEKPEYDSGLEGLLNFVN
ncbi:MAG: thymidylate synthase [Candidatus Hodarchaeota archaeon]